MSTTTEDDSKETQELEGIIISTNKKASTAKQLLKKINENTEALKLDPDCKESELRIRQNLTSTLTRKFVDVMKEYQSAQTKYKSDIRKRVKRQVQIIKPDATPEEIDAVMKSEGGSAELIKSSILKVRNVYCSPLFF